MVTHVPGETPVILSLLTAIAGGKSTWLRREGIKSEMQKEWSMRREGPRGDREDRVSRERDREDRKRGESGKGKSTKLAAEKDGGRLWVDGKEREVIERRIDVR